MNNDKYDILSSVYNNITIDDNKLKDERFRKTCNTMIGCSDITSEDIEDYILINIFLNDNMYKRMYDSDIDLDLMFYVLTEYFIIKYGEVKTYKTLDALLIIYPHILECNDNDITDTDLKYILMEILEIKSKSKNENIAIPAKIKLIKIKRMDNKKDNYDDHDNHDYFDNQHGYTKYKNNNMTWI